MDEEFPEIIEPPLDGVLDLHTFSPREIRTLIPDFIEACRAKGIYKLRIIHGKGTGTLRDIVHSILEEHRAVEAFWQEEGAGSWGATLVDLKENFKN